MTNRVGQYFGNYQLIQLLGKGGYAEVYLGKHRYLNSYAALKALYATLKPDNEHKFLSEAQRLVDLRHANIVHLLDFGIESGTAVLIMDYAPNGSLRNRYPQGTQVPLTTVVDSVTQIAAALQYAHNHNVIHRDVKPENILLDADNRLLLSDFGLSLLTPSPQQLSTQDLAGTPRYMAPEQLRGKPCFASDQYALAVMVYEWLCGELPFRGNQWEIWYQHMHADPPPLRTTLPELPLMLEQVVLRALAKKPQDRFVSIQAFALALARASRRDIPVEEHDLQVTTPLQAIPRSSPIAPPYHTALPPHSNQREQTPIEALAPVTTEELPPASTLQNQNRLRMLGRLRRAYSDLLSQSLEGAAWLELGLASVPQAVQNATNLLLHVENKAAQHLPAGASIKDAYDEAEHELLILGEPGAGKSTLLLDLAQQLVVQAEQDKTHPLPVILPLSSWAVKRPPLQDWLAEQLAQIYDVPRKLSIQWVEEDHILPLLDGLDEMEETARSACIAAINTYHRDRLAQLVVCSRTNEYEAAASRQRLALQGAIVVQPLTHSDVDAYLESAGQPLAALRSALKRNDALHDLATTPLMLNILILTYQGTLVHDLPNREALLLQQVWDDYVQRMVSRKGHRQRYPLQETRLWLSYLARQMRAHNQTIFYLEHLQPNWLTAFQQRTYTWLAVCWPALIIGGLISILVSLFFKGDTNLLSLLRYGLLGGLLGGLWSGPRNVGSPQHRSPWRKRLVKRLAVSICIGLISGFLFGFYLGSYHIFTMQLIGGLSYGVMIGGGSLLFQYLLVAPFRPVPKNTTSRGWQRVLRFFAAVHGPHALLVASVTGLSYALSAGLSYGLTYGPSYALSYAIGYGLRAGLSFGVSYALISLALGAQTGDIHLTERIRWTWRGLFKFKHVTVSAFITCLSIISVSLVYGMIFGLIYKPGIGVIYGLNVGLKAGLAMGLSYWFLLGLLQGMTQERIEDQHRHVANQGIHRSLRNSVIMSIIGGAIIGSIGILSYGLTFGLSEGLNYGLLIGPIGAFLICILTGGLAVWRHSIIRFLLQRSHTFPRRAPQFLNDATARFLLRRVGGGYSFTHRLLLDHLADEEKGMLSFIDYINPTNKCPRC